MAASQISPQDARARYTTTLIRLYDAERPPLLFFTSLFKKDTADSKNIAIEVYRGTELIAVDVERGSIGNRNTFSLGVGKLFCPPYYREYFDATEHDLYDQMFGNDPISAANFAKFMKSVARKYKTLINKINRAIELQCAQALETGIVTLVSGENIDYKRLAESKVDVGASQYFSASTANPYVTLESGCNFIRENGQTNAIEYHCIFGKAAWQDFQANETVVKRADIKNFGLDKVDSPLAMSNGGRYHGFVSAGSYNVHLWTHVDTYKDKATGTKKSYMNPKNINIIPSEADFDLVYAAVPQVYQKDVQYEKGEMIFGEYLDPRTASHDFDVKSAPLAILTGVDQCWTAKVVS